ncbi:glycerophosphodiester phosphodiesterase [Virgibacillus tibetensis]
MGCADQTPNSMENAVPAVSSEYDDSSLLSPNRILNIAHRGASGHSPEHTLTAYKTGEEMIGDYIEIDLQMTKDGQLIAMHDMEVSRTTDSEGKVQDFTLDEIKELDAGSWFNEENPELAQPVFSNVTVPSLDEIIETFGSNSNYYIETKNPDVYPDMMKELIKTLNKYDLVGEDAREGKVIIQSFSEESLIEANQLDPSIPLIQLISYQKTAAISNKEINRIKEYAIGIGANYHHLTKEYVSKVRSAGLLLHPYTVNEPEDMKRLIDWGVTGMFTDYPDRLSNVLREIEDKEI